MDLRRFRVEHYFLLALVIAAFVGAVNTAFDGLIDNHNRKQIADLNKLIVHRAESAIDYAFIALGELVEKGAADCTPGTLSELRKQVYRRGSIKDIRVVDSSGNIQCSAFPEIFAGEAGRLTVGEKVPSKLLQIQLMALQNGPDVAVGVVWEVIRELSLLAVINMETMLFDVLPLELREGGQVLLTLSNGTVVSSYVAEDAKIRTARPPATFSIASERYPVVATILIDGRVLARWNKQQRPYILGIGALLGLLFGLLFCGYMSRPRDPVSILDEAIARNEFQPFMQPIFSLQDETISGCEVLTRWVKEDGSIVPPYWFIPLAEETDRIRALTRQVIADALLHLQPQMKRDKAFKVGFNIAPAHLLSGGFVEEMRKLVAQASVSTRQIVIEITERQEFEDLQKAAEVIAELREHGFKIAIDDAGTGHNGLSYIQKLAIQTIKIDKFFVDSIETDPAAKAVVEMLVRLAKQLRMTTVAEGIESKGQIAALAACGVDEGQGYVVSPPLPAEALCALLECSAKAAQPRDMQRQLYVGAA